MTLYVLALAFTSESACLEYMAERNIDAREYPCVELVQESGAPTTSIRPKARPE